MTAKLTFKEKWMGFWGFGYFVNMGTDEIHRLETKHENCRTHMITHVKFVSFKRCEKLLKDGYNGCRYCYKTKDNG